MCNLNSLFMELVSQKAESIQNVRVAKKHAFTAKMNEFFTGPCYAVWSLRKVLLALFKVLGLLIVLGGNEVQPPPTLPNIPSVSL